MDLIVIYRAFNANVANTPSFQVHIEHSPGLISCYATKGTSVNLRKLKSYQASFPTTGL